MKCEIVWEENDWFPDFARAVAALPEYNNPWRQVAEEEPVFTPLTGQTAHDAAVEIARALDMECKDACWYYDSPVPGATLTIQVVEQSIHLDGTVCKSRMERYNKEYKDRCPPLWLFLLHDKCCFEASFGDIESVPVMTAALVELFTI